MSTLTDFEGWIKEILQDSAGVAFTTTEIDVGIRQALGEYSRSAPNQLDATITLLQDGQEISLSSLGTIESVLEVWHPYNADEWQKTGCASSRQQPAGFRFWRSDGTPYLFINPGQADRPKAGDLVRLRYTKEHTIQGLSSATKTTIPASHELAVASGAAGLCALAGAMDRSEVGNPEQIRKWADVQVKEFRRWLEDLRAQSARTGGGEPWGPGWVMDRWDSKNG